MCSIGIFCLCPLLWREVCCGFMMVLCVFCDSFFCFSCQEGRSAAKLGYFSADPQGCASWKEMWCYKEIKSGLKLIERYDLLACVMLLDTVLGGMAFFWRHLVSLWWRGMFTLVARVLRISVLFEKGASVTCETSGGLFFAACEAFRVWRIGVAVI